MSMAYWGTPDILIEDDFVAVNEDEYYTAGIDNMSHGDWMISIRYTRMNIKVRELNTWVMGREW